MKIQVVAIITLVALSLSGHAGPGASGGARGVVCRDRQQRIKTVELLDLWEARTLYDRETVASNLPVSEQVAQALERLKYSIYTNPASSGGRNYSPSEWFLKVAHEKSDLFFKAGGEVKRLRGVRLQATKDSDEPVVPENSRCKVEQLVNYFDSDTHPLILLNQDLVDKMDKVNAAALVAHETFYAMARSFLGFEKNSVRVRRAIGYVFAGFEFPSPKTLLGDRYIACRNLSTSGVVDTDTSEVDFYSGPGGVEALTVFAFGVPSIGFFASNDGHSFGKDLATLFSSNLCPDSPTPQPSAFASLPGRGPVDFTNGNTLIITCDKKVATIYLSKEGDFTPANPQRTQKLFCETRLGL